MWNTYKNLMFKSAIFESDSQTSSNSKDSQHHSSDYDKESSNLEEEGENLVDEDVSESEQQLFASGQIENTITLRHSNAMGGVFTQVEPPADVSQLYLGSSPGKSTLSPHAPQLYSASSNKSAPQSHTCEFQDTDDLLGYLFEVYKLTNHQR